MMDILRRWGNPYDGNPETLLFDYAEGATDMLSCLLYTSDAADDRFLV